MKQIFSVVPLDPPVSYRGKLCHWGCRNSLSGRIWKQSYRVTREGAESKCHNLNLEYEIYAEQAAELRNREALRSKASSTLH